MEGWASGPERWEEDVAASHPHPFIPQGRKKAEGFVVNALDGALVSIHS